MKKEILIITNQTELKEDIIKCLSKDFNVFISSLDNAFNEIKNNNFQCILDYTKDINTIDKLKDNNLSTLIPVIILSNKFDYKDIKEYVNRGAYEFVELPTDKKVLNLRINDAINTISYPKSLKQRPSFDRLCEIYNEETFITEARKALDERENSDHFL